MPTAAQKWAEAHKRYFQENKPQMLAQMQKEGTLEEHLTGIGEQAEEMETYLFLQMTRDLPENYLERVSKLEQTNLQVSELVMDDLILQPR